VSDRLQRECASEWRDRSARLIERAQTLPTEPAVLERSRAPGAWSAAQILEHLVLTNESYLAVMLRSVERVRGGAGEGRHWRPRLGGRLLVRSLRAPRPLPAPAGFQPAAQARPQVQAAFIARMRELGVLLDRSADVPWNRVRFGSPVLALLRLNLGDGFEILVTHAERHFGQIDRAIASTTPSTA
jgi:hypothetical protein